MGTGIDTSQNTQYVAQSLAQSSINGSPITFVGRYYNVNDPSKNLTTAEAQALSQAGLYIISIWENGYPTHASYFTKAQGIQDGQGALSIAQGLRQPARTPIYFAVDYDAYTSDDRAAVLAYFHGVSQALSGSLYAVGIYGGWDPLTWCQSQNLATYFWQAMSSGWSGGKNANPWPQASLRQTGSQTVAGLSVDVDLSNGDAGGWRLSS